MAKLKNILKQSFYTVLTLVILIIICFGFIFSTTTGMKMYSNILIKSTQIDEKTVDFNVYTKEEFSNLFFNKSISNNKLFLVEFEKNIGIENKHEGLILINYDIKTSKCKMKLYGINKYTNLVYSNERIVCQNE